MVEFKECESEYIVQPKEDSSEISSDGEFKDAKNGQILDESCTEVYINEKRY